MRIDPYVIALLATVGVASLLPASGAPAVAIALLAKLLIGLLFFLHGTRLEPKAVRDGVLHWRLHLVILAVSFGLFPLLALLGKGSLQALMPAELVTGFIYLCCLSSTVQSSITFTSIARGNIPAAMASATASNLLGMLFTPLLIGLFMQRQGVGLSLDAIGQILLQMLAPFAAGQLLRPLLKPVLDPIRKTLGYVDRGSILVVVYSAFSAAVTSGLWTRVSPAMLGMVAAISVVILIIVMTAALIAGRSMRFSTEDRIALIMCASKKSLVTGAPMAAILFPAATAAIVILPLMLYHQIQMIACAIVAERYSRRPVSADSQPQVAR